MDTSDRSLRITRNLSHVKYQHFSDEKKIEVVTKWMLLGNMRLVAEITGVSYLLIRQWKMAPWWADLVAEIKASRDIVVDNKLSKLVDKSLELVGDRLENGDIVWNKAVGDFDRKPVSLKDANKVADTLLTQQLNQSKKKVVESQGDTQKTIQDQIRMLAVEFARFNGNRTVNVSASVIHEGTKESANAVHDEWTPGLPEAVRQVRWPAGSNQEERREEQSSSDGDEGDWTQTLVEHGRGSQETSVEGWEDSAEQSESNLGSQESIFLT